MNKKILILAISTALGVGLTGCSKSDPARSGASGTPAASTGPVELKLKWPPGNRYVQRMELLQDSTMSGAQMPKPMKQHVTMGQEYSLTALKARDGGGSEVELEFLAAEMEVSMGERVVMNFDSKGEAGADEAQNPIASTFRKMIGSKLKYLFNASNRVEKIEGIQEFTDQMTRTAPPQARAIFQSMFNEDYLKQLVDLGQGLPAQPVKPGDKWPVNSEVSMGPMGTLLTAMDYTFKGWEQHEKHNCAVLDFTGTVKSKDGAGSSLMGMTMVLDNGTVSGKGWFDPELGMIVDAAINEVMTMRMTVPTQGPRRTNAAAAGPAPTQTITNRMDQKINLKLVEFTPGGK